MQDDYDEMRARYHGYSLDDPAPDPDVQREADIKKAWDEFEAAREAVRKSIHPAAEWPEIKSPQQITSKVRQIDVEAFRK